MERSGTEEGEVINKYVEVLELKHVIKAAKNVNLKIIVESDNLRSIWATWEYVARPKAECLVQGQSTPAYDKYISLSPSLS